MDTDAVQYSEKIGKLLEAFLQPEFQINNDCYLNSLLSHFAGKENRALGDELVHLPVVLEWLPKALAHWETNPKPPISISSFTLQLAALLSSDHVIFNYYNTHNVYHNLFKTFNIRSQNIPPTMKLSYIKILSSFLSHNAGIEWLISSDTWRDCLHFCLANQTVYIIKEGHQFIHDLLVKSIDISPPFAERVIEEIVSIFTRNFYKTNNLFPEIEDEILQKELRPTVTLIIFLFDSLLTGEAYKRRDYRLVEMLIRRHNLEAQIDKIIIISRNLDFLYDLYSVLFHIYFFEMIMNTKTDSYDVHELMSLGKRIFQIFTSLVNDTQIINVLKLAHLADTRWNCLKDRIGPVRLRNKKEPLLFQNQLVALQVMPIFGIAFIHCKLQYSDVDNDDLRDAFMQSIFQMMCESTIRLGYSWRSVIMNQTDAFDNGKLAIVYAMKNIKNYNKQRGIKIFQVLLYSLKDINEGITKQPTLIEQITRNISFCITLLDAVATFIKEFNITWRDSVETICVMACTIDFLRHQIWPPRVVVQALKLVRLSIAKFLSPNLALLVESADDTNMDLLGKILMTKLCDTNWEVRDSALEIVHTIANISNCKYPSFQKFLMKFDAIPLVITMCVNDSEGFVRASAIRCLQEMIRVQMFWTRILVTQELPKKMMNILRYETEAIVRTEAASLMRHIYEHQTFQKEQMDEIYKSMEHAATSDLHWEVKSNALDFWGKVILNHLADQGFIDGKFPNVTFSKENRKIVTLTETEIKARLNKTLVLLSKNGCLGVLVNAIQDDCDIEVSKKSLEKTKKLTRILTTYNISPTTTQQTPLPNSPIISRHPTSPVRPKIDLSDDVIDQIINSNDINLLAHVFNTSTEVTEMEVTQKTLKIVTPETFINFIHGDLDHVIENKVKWLNKMDDLNSLMDDMLRTYETNINTMDCY